MRFFATRIHDEGFCFLRDLIMVVSDLCDHGIPIYTLQPKVRQIIANRGLEDKMVELNEKNYNFDSEIKDCYPISRDELMKYASDILSIRDACPDRHLSSFYQVMNLFQRMGLTRSEKKALMVKYFVGPDCTTEVAEKLVEPLLN